MNEKEKAIAYDKALERANKLQKTCDNSAIVGWMEYIFPELRESEDERIRKGLIKAVSGTMKGNTLFGTNVTREEALAWLEKQGQVKESSISQHEIETCKENNDSLTSEDERIRKSIIKILKGETTYTSKEDIDRYVAWLEKQSKQTHTDKTQPKFKVGNWVVTDKNSVVRIKSIESNYYVLENTMRFTIDYVDKCWYLWTIANAKDGDVLYNTKYNNILIYKHQNGTKDFVSSCRLSLNTGTFYSCKEFEWGDLIWQPATNEQCDILFQKMKEAGYTFDFENKELKKIDEDGVEYKKHIMSEMANFATAYIKQKSEPTWSGNDEDKFNKVINELTPVGECPDNPDWEQREYYHGRDAMIEWLKSVKERLGGK